MLFVLGVVTLLVFDNDQLKAPVDHRMGGERERGRKRERVRERERVVEREGERGI